MVFDAVGPGLNPPSLDEQPNPEAQKFYDIMHAAENELWPGNSRHSQLSAAIRMLDLKCTHQISERAYNDYSEFLQEVLPVDNLKPKDFYSTKKLVQGLGLPVEVIHCCFNNCMLFWGEDSDKLNCKFCGYDRYKPHRQASSKRTIHVPYKKMHYFPLTPRL